MSASRRERQTRRASLLIKAIAILIAAIALISCSGSPPRIAGMYRQLAVIDNRTINARYEQLSVFVQPVDEDGFSDLARLYLINDRLHLFWSLSPDTWERRGNHNQQWIGSNNITMSDGSAFPRGEYRVVLIDLSGSRDERTFVIDQPELAGGSLTFPSLAIREQSVSVTSLLPAVTVSVIDPVGSFSARREVPVGSVPLTTIMGKEPEPGRRYDLYASVFDSKHRVELVTGPYPY